MVQQSNGHSYAIKAAASLLGVTALLCTPANAAGDISRGEELIDDSWQHSDRTRCCTARPRGVRLKRGGHLSRPCARMTSQEHGRTQKWTMYNQSPRQVTPVIPRTEQSTCANEA